MILSRRHDRISSAWYSIVMILPFHQILSLFAILSRHHDKGVVSHCLFRHHGKPFCHDIVSNDDSISSSSYSLIVVILSPIIEQIEVLFERKQRQFITSKRKRGELILAESSKKSLVNQGRSPSRIIARGLQPNPTRFFLPRARAKYLNQEAQMGGKRKDKDLVEYPENVCPTWSIRGAEEIIRFRPTSPAEVWISTSPP